MIEPTQADLDAAQTLIPCNCGTKTHKHMTDCPRHGIAWEDVADALHAAREAGRQSALPPANHILDSAGVVRRVLGTLPTTADGVVVCYAATPLWHPVLGQMDTLTGEPFAAWRNGMGKRTSDCYSTPEAAAEAARAAGGGE